MRHLVSKHFRANRFFLGWQISLEALPATAGPAGEAVRRLRKSPRAVCSTPANMPIGMATAIGRTDRGSAHLMLVDLGYDQKGCSTGTVR